MIESVRSRWDACQAGWLIALLFWAGLTIASGFNNWHGLLTWTFGVLTALQALAIIISWEAEWVRVELRNLVSKRAFFIGLLFNLILIVAIVALALLAIFMVYLARVLGPNFREL